ncbi:MFS transporter [Umezawaea sp. Da 62-37]|uniref:MFS transporter n=1 Tax=Umezawaea sp. Da 62-37 TaxID=3075927 RepID=UPI0028F6CECB|nr:MFS transporter [Umezawaea sp. Da 62-37]WNV86692.1 MFS transporter [Umezawaea sp. Da 62-37]WNV86725.1 MFS transporter [Umezawaea sp. Da 62-37]
MGNDVDKRGGGLGSRFHLLWAAYVISNTGTWIYRITLPLLVLDLTGSALQTAALYALEYGPFLLLSLPGGVFADRFDRKRLLVVGDLVAGVFALALAIMVSVGAVHLILIYAVALLLSSVEPMYHPAFQGWLPDVVRANNLDRANALLQSSDNVVSLAGPVLAGGLVAFVGFETAIYIDAFSFVASAFIILLIRVTPRPPAAVETTPVRMISGIREALRYITRENRPLLAGSLLFTGTNFAIWLIQANLVYYLTTYLEMSSTAVGMVFAAQGGGALLGSLLAPKVIRRLGNGRTIALSTVAAGLTTALLVVFRDPIGVAVVSALVFVLGSMNVVAWFTLRQRIVRRDLLGRVVATTRMIAFSSIPLASIVAGSLESMLHNMVLIILVGAGLRAFVGLLGLRSSLASVESTEATPAGRNSS